MAARTISSTSAARVTRANTTVSGPSSPIATLAKKNEPPHRMESDRSQIQTRKPIEGFCAAGRGVLSAGGEQSRCGLCRTQDRQHLEDAGRYGRAAERNPEWLGDLAELYTLRFGEASDCVLDLLLAPVGGFGLERDGELGEQRLGLGRELGARLVVGDRRRAASSIEEEIVQKLDQRARALLDATQAARQALQADRIDRAAELGLELGQRHRQKLGIGSLTQVMRIEVGELRQIEARGRATDARQIEPFDRLLGRDDLVVAMAPAQPQQVVAQRRRQEAHVAIGVDTQ